MHSDNHHPRKKFKLTGQENNSKNDASIPIPINHKNTSIMEQSDDNDTFEIPTDTEAALALLKQEFPKITGVAPFALKSQIYTVISDKTILDRELDDLKHSNKIRCFKLPTGGDDLAVMLTEDYISCIAAISPHNNLIFKLFIDRVIPNFCDSVITHTTLSELLSQKNHAAAGDDNNNRTAPTTIQRSIEINDSHITELLQSNCLTRYTGSGSSFSSTSTPRVVLQPAASANLAKQDSYVFSMPGSGPAVLGITQGRKQILDIIKRRKYKEILESELLKRKLKGSPLGVPWHLRDMVGSGLLTKTQTTVGPLIRMTTNATSSSIRK